MTRHGTAGDWNRGLWWRLTVAAVLVTAATASVLAAAVLCVGQLLAPSPGAHSIGLSMGLGLVAAVAAAVLGIVGGALTAIGVTAGFLFAKARAMSVRLGSVVVGVGAALGAMGAFALARTDTPGSWMLGVLGCAIVGTGISAATLWLAGRSSSRSSE